MSARALFTLWLSWTWSVYALWPQPAFFQSGNVTMILSDNVIFSKRFVDAQTTKVSLRKAHDVVHGTEHISCNKKSDLALDAMINATKILLQDGFKPWMLSRDNRFEPKTLTSSPVIHEITLILNAATAQHEESSDEYYALEITEDTTITITANSMIGLWRGMTTLTQLFYTHSKEGLSYTMTAPISIKDAPAFQWRGLHLDVARNYLPVSRIKRILDAMSWNKMNRLHLHATDAQSWPLQIPALPELSEQGAFECSMIYSQEDFEQLQIYANMRGIEIVTEIDLPGHTASIHDAFPDLIAGYNVQAKRFTDSSEGFAGIDIKDWSAYCAEPPCGQLKLNSTDVDSFLRKLLADVLPRVKNHTRYFHAGGDEVNKNIYLLQENLRTNDSSIIQPLLSNLVGLVHETIREAGLTPIAWEEMLLEWNLNLPRSTIIQSWIDPASVARIIDRGYHVIAGSVASTYLDCGKGQWLDFTPRAVPYQASQGFVDYCSPFKNWKQVYHYDPLYNLTAAQRPFVMGFEVHAWGEQIDAYNVETAIWPRAAAAAEVGWSGSLSSGARVPSQAGRDDRPNANRSMEDVGARLSEWRERMVHRGIQVEPIHSMWCTQRPGQCSL